jgi:hypothetical protein
MTAPKTTARLDADRTARPRTELAEKAPTPLPIGAKYGVERCLEWLRDHAVSREAEIDDECDGADADAFCAQAATIRKAAREMAKAFGVEWKQ